MSPLPRVDVDALELGFFTDSVLRALKATNEQRATDESRRVLGEASERLEALAASVGPPSVGVAPKINFGALRSFRYAAEALRAMPNIAATGSLRSQFLRLAGTTKRLGQGQSVKQEGLQAVTDFFRSLAEVTFHGESALLRSSP